MDWADRINRPLARRSVLRMIVAVFRERPAVLAEFPFLADVMGQATPEDTMAALERLVED